MRIACRAALMLVFSALCDAKLAPAAQDVVIADFEENGYAGWQAVGKAFGSNPATGALPSQQLVSGFEGHGLANSFHGGDGSTGTLTSSVFGVDRRYINLLVGGGNHPDETCINLLAADTGKILRTATGNASTAADDEHLSWRTWDMADLAGNKAQIQIVDRGTGAWGHINVDQITASDVPRVPPQLAAPVALATSSTLAAAARAQNDPLRPIYHFAPPALWTNDPNGPIYHNGFYHLFYQHNPFGDRWEHMHWGHARSRDLVHWEHLPAALCPSYDQGEDHCFSGCATVDGQGRPIIIYTSIGPKMPAHDGAQQWAALGDDDLLTWKKHPANPLLSQDLHGSQKIYDWRDPFVFQNEGKTFLVAGGNLNEGHGGQAIVALYRAKNSDLTQWEYLGILFQHPDKEVGNIECPNFFRLGDKWVLVVSPHRHVDYFVGDFDSSSMKFLPQSRGVLDAGHYYAPNCLEDPSGRRIMWGWINGFQPGRGWTGCMSVPRAVSLSPQGELMQTPAEELHSLRRDRRAFMNLSLDNRAERFDQPGGDSLELLATFEPGSAKQFGVRVRQSSDGQRAITIAYDGKELTVGAAKTPLALRADESSLDLRVLLDKSVLEVFAGSRICITQVIAPRPEDLGLELFATEGTARVRSLEIWRMANADSSVYPAIKILVGTPSP